ncbi:MAG: rRNA maturation RNase YbeY [Sedimentisphaerales bacterium]|nr:rRNA maturation RNase YbeY [Sedimentisphaerales bacterium]
MDSDETIVDVAVEITSTFGQIKVDVPRLRRFVKTICVRYGLTNAEISIALVDDRKIRDINKEFLKHDSSTDCISFDLSDTDAERGPAAWTNGNDTLLPRIIEVIVNAERAIKESKSRGHTTEAEVALYTAHGMLHNLGFDDSAPDKAEEMHRAEDKILSEFGYGTVYERNIRR